MDGIPRESGIPVRITPEAHHPTHGRCQQDPTAARRLHPREEGPRHVGCPEGVDADQAVDVGDLHVIELPRDRKPGTVGQNLHAGRGVTSRGSSSVPLPPPLAGCRKCVAGVCRLRAALARRY